MNKAAAHSKLDAGLVPRVSGKREVITNAKIMMVDDEPIMMSLVQAFLEEAGYQNFVNIEQPELAMEAVHTERPDVLLLDLVMPGVSGFEILANMRADAEFKHVPVIVLTASTEPETKLRALEIGATDFLAKPVDPSELVLRLRNTLEAKAYQDQLAYYDSVTGLPNRRLFMEQLEWALTMSRRNNIPVSVLQIGLKGFNDIENVFGSVVGNQLLSEVASRIESVVRESDKLGMAEGALIESRLSHQAGDQFSVLLPGMQSAENASVVARRVIKAVEKPIHVEGNELKVGCSVGISVYPGDANDAPTLVSNAGSAMQKGISSEENCQFYSREIDDHFRARLKMENHLRRAIARDELKLFYQPKVEVNSDRIYGVEALIRWQSPELGMVSPIEFIPLAEETGLIVSIGSWVIEEACRQIKDWQEKGLDELQVAVNVSALQIRDDRLLTTIRRALVENQISASRLTVELTESQIMDNVDENIELIRKVQALGCRISIDDFGTGYSSLSYLKRFPVDELKIDRSFIMHVHEDPGDAAIVNAIITMAKGLGLSIVCEGVEDERGVEFLKGTNGDLWQGYFCSRPVSADQLLDLFRKTGGLYR